MASLRESLNSEQVTILSPVCHHFAVSETALIFWVYPTVMYVILGFGAWALRLTCSRTQPR